LKAALPRLARAGIEDVLAAVGRGEIYSGDVVKAVYPDFSDDRKASPQHARPEGEGGWFGLPKAESLVFKFPGHTGESDPLPIHGLQGDLPVRFAPNGGAVPGDRIVAILTPGEGITIYPIQSPDLTAFDDQPERWLDVRWDLEAGSQRFFPARILVTAINEPGTLGMIATVIGDMGANIDNITINVISPDFREMIIDLEIADLKHLIGVIGELRTKPVISKVERVNG
jgi:guanosine-3',5'-bis(diphosphate) 3'-pyrophosphohydrolase